MYPNNQEDGDKSTNKSSFRSSGKSVDGFVPVPRQANIGGNFDFTQPRADLYSRVEMGQQQLNAQPNVAPKGRIKLVLLIIFIILFVIATAGASYFYIKYSQMSDQLKIEKSTTQALNQQIILLEKTATDLAIKNAADLKAQKDYAVSLSDVASQLKIKCGTSCNSIVIPVYENE